MPLLVQFLPLTLFATYAFWAGPTPPPERWERAFMLGGVAALVQMALVLRQRAPVNRLLLGANLYLLVGGLATVTRQWRVLVFYGLLKGAGIFAAILLVGLVTTIFSPSGYVGRRHPDRQKVRFYSLVLLGLTAAGLVVTVLFRGSGTWPVALPLLVVAIANQVLAHRLDQSPNGTEARAAR